MSFVDFSLENKVVLVTGASKGIGRNAALHLAHAGADVIVTARDKKQLEDLVSEIRSMGRKAEFLIADLENVSNAVDLGRGALHKMGHIDILVNNAGVTYLNEAINVTVSEWDKTFSVNLKSLFFLTQKIGRAMIERGYGKIINISSLSGLVGFEEHAVYCATKGGLMQLTRVLALEWGPKGINVNAIAPVIVLTPMAEKVWSDPTKRNNMLKNIPIGRFALPKDISGAILFLASSASDMVNGEILTIDGGYTAR